MYCALREPSLIRFLTVVLGLSFAHALTLDTTSADSIKDVSSKIAYGMMKYYTGNNTGDTPGNLPNPYYWWEAGAMFGKMVEYWYYTGDATYNDDTIQAMCWQAGKFGTYMPDNQTKTEGNDDQVFWAYAAMSAAELGFPPPQDGYPSWAAMAQGVFNLQANRWDTTTCEGGLKWQIFPWNAGYNYKNTPSNGGFFLLAAKLARYTNNQTYVEWAEKSWDWFSSSVLYESQTHIIQDGTNSLQGCINADQDSWSYNYGFYIGGLAYMYNHTKDEKWMTPLQGILNQTLGRFFPVSMGPYIAVETHCEPFGTCVKDLNTFTFKGFLIRWMVEATQMVPSLHDQLFPYINASAIGAAGQCSGGTDGMTCGMRWNSTTWDGLYGVGQQMSALSVVSSMMLNVANLAPPLTLSTGGTSKSDPNAGTNANSDGVDPAIARPITSGDRAGAGILTAFCVILTLYAAYWIVTGD